MKKRILASFLSLVLVLSLVPTAALAADESGADGESPAVCTCTALCAEGSVDATCPVCAEDDTLCAYTAPAEPAEEPGDESVEEPTEGPAGEPEGPACAGLEGCDGDTHAGGCPLYVEPEEPTNEDKLIPSTESTEELLSGTASSRTDQELEGAEGSNLTWALTDNTLTISGTGAMKDYGYSGRREVPWYNQKNTITKVVFGDGVTHIGSFAFYQHTALTSFEMAGSVVSFGQGAFQGCSALTTIPKLHANFQDFSTEVFVDAKISTYEVDEANPYYTVKDGILYSEDETTLINCPPGKAAAFNQNWLDGVTAIAPYAFRTCKSLTGSLVIPAHITSIGRQAFQNCSGLTGDLTVPNTVTDLDGYYAFAGLSGMTGTLTLGSNITEIAGGMFNGGGFTCMEWQGVVTSVGDYAFTNCKFTNFVLPASVMTVGAYAFSGCSSNESFGTLEHLTSIGRLAFKGCKFADVTISDHAAAAEQAFDSCTIDGALIVSEGATVGAKAFTAAKIATVDYRAPIWSNNAFFNATISEKVILADSVTDIGSGSFAEETEIEATLKNVKTIGNNVFKGATFTTDISIPAGATVGNNAFENAALKNVSYNAETASYAAFKGATIDSLTLGDNTKAIAAYAFQSSKIGGNVLKLGKVETIEKYAFSEAQLPATVIVPETATYYNNHVFYETTGGKTLLVYGSYNMVPTALTHGSEFKTVVITADIVNNDNVKYGDGQKAHNRLTSMPEGHIIYMTNSASSANAEVPNKNGVVGVTNGGTFAEDTVFTSGTLAAPTKDGAIFEGWYANADFTGEKVTAISNAKTYFAKWIELTAKDIEMEYGSEKKLSQIKIDGVALTDWTSADPAIVKIACDKLIATGVGETTITADASLTRSGEKLTVKVKVTPMSITFGTEDGENPGGQLAYDFTGKAPEFSTFAKFYPAKVENGKVSVVEGSEAVALTEGTDIVFVYNAGAGEQEYEYLPIDVTDSEGISVTIKLVNPNYRFVTESAPTQSDSIKETVIVRAEGKTEAPIMGVPAAGETMTYPYNGQPQPPVSNLTRMSAGSIKNFTIHFHPWGDTEFTEAHLTDKPINELTPEAIASIAPTEPGSYLMIVDGVSDTEYAYRSWIFTITKATVTIRPNDKSAYVGDAVPVLGTDDYTVTGLVGDDTLSTEPTLAYEGTPDMSKAGTYAIKASGAAANETHYTLLYEDGTLTVSRRSSGGGGGGSSSGNTTTETEKNPDGSTTTTVTDKKTGTVTETTKFKDGSTLVVETKKDGTVTTTETAKNGVKVRTVEEPGEDVTAKVTIPKSVGEAVVTIPADVDYGMVAVDADTGEVVKLSVPTREGMTVKLDGSADLVLVDRSRDFTDTRGHWAEDAIDFATAHELFAGTSDTTFTPDSPMTRAMLMTVLARFDGQDTTGGAVWYEKAMAWARENGISDGSNPNGSITREQLATMLWRYAGSPAGDGSAIGRFTDSGKVSSYAVEAMNWAVGTGLIGGMGDGTLAPQGSATRAQVATILMRFVENLTK